MIVPNEFALYISRLIYHQVREEFKSDVDENKYYTNLYKKHYKTTKDPSYNEVLVFLYDQSKKSSL